MFLTFSVSTSFKFVLDTTSSCSDNIILSFSGHLPWQLFSIMVILIVHLHISSGWVKLTKALHITHKWIKGTFFIWWIFEIKCPEGSEMTGLEESILTLYNMTDEHLCIQRTWLFYIMFVFYFLNSLSNLLGWQLKMS